MVKHAMAVQWAQSLAAYCLSDDVRCVISVVRFESQEAAEDFLKEAVVIDEVVRGPFDRFKMGRLGPDLHVITGESGEGKKSHGL
jgi:hypothetical protein